MGRACAASIFALLAAQGLGCFSEEGGSSPSDGGDAASATTGPSTSLGASSTDVASSTVGDTTTGSGAETAGPGETLGDASSTADSTTEGIDCELPPGAGWDETFDRPDGDELGNCWIEKSPPVWRLANGEVESPGEGTTEPFDHLVWRDGALAANVEIKLEFRIRSGDPRNEPTAMVRMTQESLQPGAPYRGYALAPRAAAVGEPTQLCLMRFDGAADPGEQRCENLPGPLELGPTRYRLVLEIAGPGPVVLDGRIDVLHEGDQDWSPLLALPQWVDSAPDQITGPGAVGFSGGASIDVLDNFVIEGAQIFNRD